MELAAPPGPVYQAGTLSGNPLAISAEIETLKMLRPPGTREHLEASAASLEAGLRQAATAAGVESCLLRVGSLLTLFFGRDGHRLCQRRHGRYSPLCSLLPGAPARGGLPATVPP